MDPQSSRTVIRPRRRQPIPGQASASTGHETNPHAGTGQNESSVFSVAAAAPAALSANSAGASQNSQGHDSHNEANNGVNRARYRLGLNADSSDPVSEGDLAIRAVERGLAPPFVIEVTPFGSVIPSDIKSGAVPFDLNYQARFMAGGRYGEANRAFTQLPDTVKADIAFHMYIPDPRDIRAIWASDHLCWVYYSLDQPNTVPFVINGFGGAMAHYSFAVFNPAPSLGLHMPYPFFNFEHDVLFLDYKYCGNTEEQMEKYGFAIECAVYMLSKYHNSFPGRPKLKSLKISYCPQMFSVDDLPQEKCCLGEICGVEKVILVAHDE